MKIQKIPPEELKKIIESAPAREKGKYDKILEDVKRNKTPVKIDGLTRGQAWGLFRKAKNMGLRCRVLNGGESVVIYQE